MEEVKAGERLLLVLLVLCAVLFSIALASGIYVYWSTGEIRKARLLVMGPQELMERMMKGRASDECARPHTISDIGFVLNPAMQRCTLWVDEDQPYDVNAMGLRGREIPAPDSEDAHRRRVLVAEKGVVTINNYSIRPLFLLFLSKGVRSGRAVRKPAVRHHRMARFYC